MYPSICANIRERVYDKLVLRARHAVRAKQNRVIHFGCWELVSCHVSGRPSLIYPPGLKNDLSAFAQLQHFAEKNQLVLLEERRKKNLPCLFDRRTPLLPALALTASFGLTAGHAHSESLVEDSKTAQIAHLNLINKHKDAKHSDEAQQRQRFQILDDSMYTNPVHTNPVHTNQEYTNEEHVSKIQPDPGLAKKIERILSKRFVASPDDPAFTTGDLKAIAHYFGAHPKAAELVLSLENVDWQLRYQKGTYQTSITGNRFKVKSAVVYFDSRTAAKLKFSNRCAKKLPFCVASPADALLHELLHVQAALLTPKTFLADGGLNGMTYPFKHEQRIIQKENELYRAMTKTDGLNRPLRKTHAGRFKSAACVTCIQ